MRRYEQVYILRPSLSEEQINTIIENTNQLIQDDGGAIIFLNKWGMRKLAYLIKKETQGYYVLCDFAASPEIVAEIERKFRIDDAVLKYLTVKISDSISAEEIEVAQSEAEAKAVMPEPEEDETDLSNADKAGEVSDENTDEEDSDDGDESDETSDDEDEDAENVVK